MNDRKDPLTERFVKICGLLLIGGFVSYLSVGWIILILTIPAMYVTLVVMAWLNRRRLDKNTYHVERRN